MDTPMNQLCARRSPYRVFLRPDLVTVAAQTLARDLDADGVVELYVSTNELPLWREVLDLIVMQSATPFVCVQTEVTEEVRHVQLAAETLALRSVAA